MKKNPFKKKPAEGSAAEERQESPAQEAAETAAGDPDASGATVPSPMPPRKPPTQHVAAAHKGRAVIHNA